MEYLVGFTIAVAVFAFAWLSGFDRDRAFYPTVLIVVAHYYILFAAMAGSSQALVVETLLAGVFIAMSVVGFKKIMWVVAAGLAGHGIFDIFHGGLIENPGVPVFWPGFCMAFDVAAGILLGLMLMRRAAYASQTVR